MADDTRHAGRLDERFSEAETATPWAEVDAALGDAELYWISTVRRDGRPHVTPLIGLWEDDAWFFVTGQREQKAVNLEANPSVAVTTGTNRWNSGLDVVLEGAAERVTGRARLQEIADAFVAKYGEVWRFEVGEDGFGEGELAAGVYRVALAKVMAFAKNPHAHTTFRL